MKYTSISKEKYIDLVYKTGHTHDDISSQLVGILIENVIVDIDKITIRSKNGHIITGCKNMSIFKNSLNIGDIITEVIFEEKYVIIRSNNGILYFSGKEYTQDNILFDCSINLFRYDSKYNYYKTYLSKYINSAQIKYSKYPKSWHISITAFNIEFYILRDNYFLCEIITSHNKEKCDYEYYLIDQIDGVIEFLQNKKICTTK